MDNREDLGALTDSIWFDLLRGDGEESEAVEDLLAGNVICGMCGATLQTYADKCSVASKVACPGFLSVEGARLHHRRMNALATEAQRAETSLGSVHEGAGLKGNAHD